jgi:hypothetical protein
MVMTLHTRGEQRHRDRHRPQDDLPQCSTPSVPSLVADSGRDRGYGLLTDAQHIACIDLAGVGGMGVHWANSALVGDPAIIANRPEALVYAPGRDGTLTLAAVEYVVFRSDWDATHGSPPRLFGHTFDVTGAANRFGLPAYYSLHVWLWKVNPAGTFEMWNPRVRCPAG